MHRTNFHEDPLRHFLIKAANARDDGYFVGAKPSRLASQATLVELFNRATTPPEIKKRLAGYIQEEVAPSIDSEAFLERFDATTQKKLRMLLGK